jgi:hypothetical protein
LRNHRFKHVVTLRYAAFAVLTSRYWRMHSCRHRPQTHRPEAWSSHSEFSKPPANRRPTRPARSDSCASAEPVEQSCSQSSLQGQHNEILVLDTKVEKFGWPNAPKRASKALQVPARSRLCTGGGRGNGTRLGSDWRITRSCKRPCVGNPHDLKATALTSRKARNVGRIFAVGFPRFVSNKANPRCAIRLTRSPFPAGPTFKVRMKRQSKVCAPMSSVVSAKSIRS